MGHDWRLVCAALACALSLCAPSLVLAQAAREGGARAGDETTIPNEVPRSRRSPDDARAHEPRGDSLPAVEGDDPDEVIVVDGSAPLTPLPPSARAVDQQALSLTPRRSADELLRLVPGLHIAQHASEGKAQQFFLRGFDAVHGSDLAVSVAGVPINEPSNVHGHGYVDIGFVIPEVVAGLEARKGSFSADQSDFATAGSVAFELGVQAAQRGARLSYEAGTTNRHRALALIAPEDAPAATFVAAEALSDSGFGQNRAARRATLLGQHRFELAPGRFVDVTGAGYTAQFGEPGVAPLAAVEAGDLGFYDTFADDAVGRSSRALAAARFHNESDRHVIDARVYGQLRRLELRENFTGFLSFPDMGDARDQAHDAATLGATLLVHSDLAPGLAIVGSGLARTDWLAQSEEQVGMDAVAWRENRDVRARLSAVGAGLAVQLARGPWRAEVGGRADVLQISARDRVFDDTRRDATTATVSPRARTSLEVAPGWQVFAAYGHGLRSPEARAVALGDEAQFTTSRSAELGVSRQTSGFTASATGFGAWIENEVVFDHVAGTTLVRNATRRLGAEVAASFRATDWLGLRADATYVHARFTDSGSPVPGVPGLLGRLEARGQRGPWAAGVLASAMAPRDLAFGARGQAFAVVDAMARRSWQSFALELQIDNLLNSQWRESEFQFASRFDPAAPPSQLPRLHFAPGRPLGARLVVSARF